MIGRVVGAYRIVRQLGRGGMGTVYLARSSRGEQVALKVLHQHLGDEKPHVERFRREADAGTQLQHPAILRTLGTGEMADGHHYFAMEYFRGRTVAQLLAGRGAFTERQALVVAYRVATALDHAHCKGFMHRDIKPANIMVNRAGTVYVTDFGLALLYGHVPASEIGAFLGTAAYCPPEQLRGEAVDGRADLYALGATMYEMLTGRPLHTGDGPLAVLKSIEAGSAVPIADLRDDLGPDTTAVLDALLEPDPVQRPAFAAGVAERLKARLHDLFPDLDSPEAFEEGLRREAQVVFLGTMDLDTEGPDTAPIGAEPAAAAEEADAPAATPAPFDPEPGPGAPPASPRRKVVDRPAVARSVRPTGPSWIRRHAALLVVSSMVAGGVGAWIAQWHVSVGLPVLVRLVAVDGAGVGAFAVHGVDRFGARAVPVLAAALPDAQGAHRQRLYQTLREIGTPEVAPHLAAALGDPDPVVRVHAVDGLIALATPGATAMALAALRDADPRVRAAALTGLQFEADSTYLPHLAQAYQGADPTLRGQLTRTIAAYGGQALPHLRAVWMTLDADGRRAVVQCAGRIGGPAASRMLVDRVDDPEFAVRFLIVEVLQRLTGQDIGDDPVAWRAWSRSAFPDTERT